MPEPSANVLNGLQISSFNGGDMKGESLASDGLGTHQSFSSVFDQAQSNQSRDHLTGHSVPAEDVPTGETERFGEGLASDTDGSDQLPQDSTNARNEHLHSQNTADGARGSHPLAPVEAEHRSSMMGLHIDSETVVDQGELPGKTPGSIEPSELTNVRLLTEGRGGEHERVNLLETEASSLEEQDLEVLTPVAVTETPPGIDKEPSADDRLSPNTAHLPGREPESLLSTDETSASLLASNATETTTAKPTQRSDSSTSNNYGLSSSPNIGVQSQHEGRAGVGVSNQGGASPMSLANRLNTDAESVNLPVGAQPMQSDATNEVERVTTVAGIQSTQAGLSGMLRTTQGGTSTGPVSTLPKSAVNLDGAPLAAEQLNTSSVSQTALDSGIKTNTSLLNDTGNTSATPVTPKENLTSSALLNGNESPLKITLNPMPDNMLSATASGIVTAPIIAKAEPSGLAQVTTPLNVPLLTPAATDSLAGNVRWMVGEGVQNAVVNVTPSGMGPISVQIGLEKEQMSISIVATQTSTREALESMLPRLRDQLGIPGVDSVRVDISDGKSDRSGGFSGFERQSSGYASTENSQNSQDNLSDENKDPGSSHFVASQSTSSGERVLSESERALVDQLKNSSTSLSVKNLSVSHGYDMYV